MEPDDVMDGVDVLDGVKLYVEDAVGLDVVPLQVSVGKTDIQMLLA